MKTIDDCGMKTAMALMLIAALLLAGCAANPGGQPQNQTNQTPLPPPPPDTNQTSASSKFCTDAGYKIELKGSAPAQASYCVFPNGRSCGEMSFYNGQCSDYDSFELVESPGFVADPKEARYKFFADGRLVLTENQLRNGTSTTLMAWLTPADFAHFVKGIKEGGFESFEPAYNACGGEGGCPTDMPSISITLLRQGVEKTVSLYAPADRPAALDKIIIDFKAFVEKTTFLEPDASGCKLMKEGRANTLQCFGCPGGITNPKCTSPPNPAWYAINDSSMGECAIDAQGACTYQPPSYLTEELCNISGGRWNQCGSPESCRDPRLARVCIDMCVSYCECGGGVGNCPAGYFCTQFVPANSGSGQVGICKPIY